MEKEAKSVKIETMSLVWFESMKGLRKGEGFAPRRGAI